MSGQIYPDIDSLFRQYAKKRLGNAFPEAGIIPALQDPAAEPWLEQLEPLYNEWITMRDEQLGVPADFFANHTPRQLMEALIYYVAKRWAVPPMLMDALADHKDGDRALIWLIERDWSQLPDRIVIIALDLIQERGMPIPASLCVAHLHDLAQEDGLAARLVEVLIFGGEAMLPTILAGLDDECGAYGRLCLLEALAEIGGAQAVSGLREAFLLGDARERAEAARMLQKVGDESVLPMLQDALPMAVDAAEYQAIKEAMESMGVFVDVDPEGWENLTFDPDDINDFEMD